MYNASNKEVYTVRCPNFPPFRHRLLIIAGVITLHGLALVALRPAGLESRHVALASPPLAITLITAIPLEPAQRQAPGSASVTLAIPLIDPIASPTLTLSARPLDLAALAPYVRCALPGQLWREDTNRCENMRAALITTTSPPPAVEPNARMVAFAREAAERDAPKRLECIARRDKSANWKCNSHSIWRDDDF
jgi:hypothetical protein